jgi:hypothetical protein
VKHTNVDAPSLIATIAPASPDASASALPAPHTVVKDYRLTPWEAGLDEAEIRARIEMLKRDHRDLDTAIEALRLLPTVDMIQLQRFKKRKLRLRDEIAVLEDMLIPDIIA